MLLKLPTGILNCDHVILGISRGGDVTTNLTLTTQGTENFRRNETEQKYDFIQL